MDTIIKHEYPAFGYKHSKALMATVALSAIAFGQNAGNSGLPNFVIILTDDMGYGDLKCYNGPVPTPNIDALADDGMRCTDYHVAQSVCSPSRAALLTGCYPKRTGINNKIGATAKGLDANELTIAEVLQKREYTTGCIGKWDAGVAGPTAQGFDYYFEDDYNDSDSNMWKRALCTKELTEKAEQFIDANAAGPFFLYLAHHMPHNKTARSDSFVNISKQYLDVALQSDTTKVKYYDAVMELDWSVGRITSKLMQRGIDENSMVVFISDNGPIKNAGSPGPFDGGKGAPKWSVWEGGLRVPCVIRWPHLIPQGVVCDELMSAMDFLPTIARIAGVKLPDDRQYDGYDILSLLKNEAGARSSYKFFPYPNVRDTVMDLDTFHPGDIMAMRQGNWKYFREGNQLFDLSSDPGESHDSSANHPDIVSRLRFLADSLDTAVVERSPAQPVLELIDPIIAAFPFRADHGAVISPKILVKGGMLTIDNSDIHVSTFVRIYRLNGGMIHSQSVESGQCGLVKISDWPVGLYIASMVQKNGREMLVNKQFILF